MRVMLAAEQVLSACSSALAHHKGKAKDNDEVAMAAHAHVKRIQKVAQMAHANSVGMILDNADLEALIP